MTKLSPAQEKALLIVAQNEWNEINGKRMLRYNGKKPTYRELNKHGLIQVTRASMRDGGYEAMLLTDTGHIAAIDLLHADAASEMASVFAEREREYNNAYNAAMIQKEIVDTYAMEYWEVGIFSRDIWEIKTWNICFNQQRGKWRYDPVRISHDVRNGYEVATTSSHYSPVAAKRMAELMLIAVQVIESGVLS